MAKSANRNLNLYIQKNTDEIYKLCLDCAKNGKHVVLFTQAQHNILPLLAGREITKDMLQLFEIIYFPHMADIAKKLLELHESIDMPRIIIVNLCDFVTNYHELNVQEQQLVQHDLSDGESSIEHGYSNANLLHMLSFCLAAILNFLNWSQSEESALNLQNLQSSLVKANNKCTVVVTLPENSDILQNSHLQVLQNLYFYHENAVLNDTEKLRHSILGIN